MGLFEALTKYEYLQNAYLAGAIIALISPIFGSFVIAKKASLIPDTIGHVSFAASTLAVLLVALGILPKTTPTVLIVMLAVVFMALLISQINHKYQGTQDIALSFVMTFSLGAAIIFYQISPVKTDLSGYLFGNIVALTRSDVLYILVTACIAALFMWRYYHKLLLLTFDSVFAKIRGIKVFQVDTIFFILLAIIIAASSKFVGVLLISALMNLPVMIVMPFTKSFKQTIFVSILVSELAMLTGLISSYYLGLPTSGVVAILLGLLFLAVLGIRQLPQFKYN